jgi:DNA repair protein RecO (recombination protein O)
MRSAKTRAVILSLTPYRESSALLRLYTDIFGLVSGIAKGVRRRNRGQDLIERGFLVETAVYCKPGRDLQTVGACAVLDGYPSVRQSLVRGALRDTAFEAFLSAVKDTGEHPELFLLLERFLSALERTTDADAYPAFLWFFLYRLADLQGVAPELSACMRCGKSNCGGYLFSARGGLLCAGCEEQASDAHYIPASALPFISGRSHDGALLRTILSRSESRRVSHILADYCRYHFECPHAYRALAFLETMTDW